VEVNPDSSKIIDKADLCAGVARADILFALLHDRVDKDVLDANPELRAVNAMVITPDQIDVAEATRRKIPVTNIPAIVTDATADICFALLLAVARRVVEGDKLFRAGIYPGSQSNHLAGAAVSGKTMGLIGAGRIGQAMARRAHGFGMKVLYADPRRAPQEIERSYGMTQRSFDEVLREADFISLHPQLTPETRHLIGAREFGLMKKTAYILNTSRGPVIDEAALVSALKAKTIAGAGLDVYEFEPKVSPELVAMNNVVLTPHLGSAVYELREGMAHVVTDNVLAIIEGRRPPNVINPEIYG
jgi:glyoxylate reductase